MPERALLIWNPVAGRRPRRRQRQIEQLAQALRRGGWQVDAAATVAGGGARPAAERARREGYGVIVACGGDGTLHQIVQALRESDGRPDRDCKLAVVPWGTANVLAGALGCPRSPRRAARWLLRAQARTLPLGRVASAAGTRYFVAVASVGVDAEAVHRLRFETKRRWGKLAYVAASLAAWRHYFPAPIEFVVAGRAACADGIVVGLTRFYGGRLRLGRVAPGDSIALALRGAPRWMVGQALALLTVGLEHGPWVERLAAASIQITTPGRPLELDGEPAGWTPAEIEVIPKALTVLASPRS